MATTCSTPARRRPRHGMLLLFLQMPLAAVVAGSVLDLVSLPVASFAVFTSGAAFPAWVSRRMAGSDDPADAVRHLHRYAVVALGAVTAGTIALIAASAVTDIGVFTLWRELGADFTGEPTGSSWSLLAGLLLYAVAATCTVTSAKVLCTPVSCP